MHDTSTVMISDRIILINNGRKVDEGSHEDLLGRSALYRDLNSIGQRRAGSWA
jgi:ATP-binding cassette subfamily B protein